MVIELYTKDDCVYCTRAKTLLREKNLSYTEYKLNEDFTREHLLGKYPGAKTFPVVIVDGYRIGGYTELNETLNQNTSSSKFLVEGNI